MSRRSFAVSRKARPAPPSLSRCCARCRRRPRRTVAPDEASLDAALCRRLSRRYRSPDDGAAWRLSALDDALLAQGGTPRRRPPAFENHQTAAENLVRLPADLAGFLPLWLEAQADRCRA